MTVEVKKVGNYKIHVKETKKEYIMKSMCLLSGFVLSIVWAICVYIAMPPTNGIYKDVSVPIIMMICSLIPYAIAVLMVGSDFIAERLFPSITAYYVDTTMYGVGGETILKTTPEQDHIAICRAAQKFEKEILERIKREDELKEIVGTCK